MRGILHRHSSRTSFLSVPVALGLALGVGCTAPEDLEPEEPRIERVALQDMVGQPVIEVVGVTVDPVTAERYLLDSSVGIFALRDQGPELIVALAEMPTPDVPLESEFTDIAAMGDGHFALTARNDGYLLDVAAGTLRQYFCYLPPGEPVDTYQLTLSVTFDADNARLLAQPRSALVDTDDILGAAIAEFDPATGLDLRWYILPSAEFQAGGMVMESRDMALLGQGSMLYRYDMAGGALTEVLDLAEFGVDDIAGMTYDPGTDEYVLIDGTDLVTVPSSLLQ